MAVQAAAVASAIKGADNKKLIIVGSVVIVAGVLVYFGIVNPLLKFLQIKDTKEERNGKADGVKLSNSQVLSPQAYLENRDKISISSAKAASLANDAYSGKWGGCYGFCDDESKGVGSVTNAGSKINVSYVAYKFNQLYSADFEEYLKSYLEPENLTSIENYVSKAPKW